MKLSTHIWGYIATDNPKAADSLLDEIEDKFILLSEQAAQWFFYPLHALPK